MTLSDYIRSLNDDELKDYALRCKSTPAYISGHILYARKEPRKALREALSAQSKGCVSPMEVLEHFGFSVSEKQDSAA